MLLHELLQVTDCALRVRDTSRDRTLLPGRTKRKEKGKSPLAGLYNRNIRLCPFPTQCTHVQMYTQAKATAHRVAVMMTILAVACCTYLNTRDMPSEKCNSHAMIW